MPDLAAWRRSRLPLLPDAPFLAIAPDWVCEILSPSTVKRDRSIKLDVYAREGVAHAWLVDPTTRMLEAFRREGTRWLLLGAFGGEKCVRLEPFDAIEIAVDALFADLAPI